MKKKSEPDKLGAIYTLRQAAEEHGRAEERLMQAPSTEKVEDVIRARIVVDAKTEDAVQACKTCGRPHAPTAAECVTGGDGGNVINLNFRQG